MEGDEDRSADPDEKVFEDERFMTVAELYKRIEKQEAEDLKTENPSGHLEHETGLDLVTDASELLGTGDHVQMFSIFKN